MKFLNYFRKMENINVSGEPTMKKSTLIDLFKNHILDPLKEVTRTHYADCFIFNNEKQLLLLKRCENDEFAPCKYCLPGGKIENGEILIDGAYRELLEETGLRTNLTYLDELLNDNGSISHYYIGYISPYQEVVVSEEHDGFIWADKDNYKDLDLLLDLKNRIENLFTDSDIDYYKLFNEIFVENIEINKAIESEVISGKFKEYLEKSYYSWSNIGQQGQLKFSKEDEPLQNITQYYYDDNYYDDKGNRLINVENVPIVADADSINSIFPVLKRKNRIYNEELNKRKKYYDQFNNFLSFVHTITEEMNKINSKSTVFDLYKVLSIVRRNIRSEYNPMIGFQFSVNKTYRSLNFMLEKLNEIMPYEENMALGIDIAFLNLLNYPDDFFNTKDFSLDEDEHNSILEFVNKTYKEEINNDFDNGYLEEIDYLNLLKYA